MKQFWHKLGSHKTDEMEQQMQSKAMALAYYFLIAALFVWTMYGNLSAIWDDTRTTTLVPCFLLVAASLIQTSSILIMRRRATAGDEEYKSDFPLAKVLLFTLAFTVVFTVVVSALTFWLIGMR